MHSKISSWLLKGVYYIIFDREPGDVDPCYDFNEIAVFDSNVFLLKLFVQLYFFKAEIRFSHHSLISKY